jgi:pilus assembly protein Flp/PilA
MLKFFVAAQCRAMNAMDELRKSERGQTMAEYGVVLAVIAVIVVVALTALSGGITGALNKVTAKL